jgi:hypothetical protein
VDPQDPSSLSTSAPAVDAEGASAWQMLGGALTMLAVGAFVFFQLSRLENGDADSVRVWGPIAAAYHLVGFWPAVCIAPTISLYMASLAVRRALEQAPPGDALA